MIEITKEQKLSLLDDMQKEYQGSEAYPGAGYPFDDDPEGLKLFKLIVDSIRSDISQPPTPKVVTLEQIKGFIRGPLRPIMSEPEAIVVIIKFLADLGYEVVAKEKKG